MSRNVLGEELKPCSTSPLTGFFRDGLCHTCAEDRGMHTVCALMSSEFLEYSKSRGNDLSTPRPELYFPGLVAGDRWCLCLARWLEARADEVAPRIFLEATHASVAEFIDQDELQRFAAPT